MITKEQFLSGKVFKVGDSNRNGIPTYKVERTSISNDAFITDQVRSGLDNRVILENHHMNIDEVTDEGFTGYTNVLGLSVSRDVKFSDLYLVEEDS
jgi:hypothetical protein